MVLGTRRWSHSPGSNPVLLGFISSYQSASKISRHMIVGLQKLPEQAESNDIKSGFIFYSLSFKKQTKNMSLIIYFHCTLSKNQSGVDWT